MSIFKKISLFFFIIFGLFCVTYPVLAQWGTQFFNSSLFVKTPANGAAGIIVNIVMWMMSIIVLLALGFIVFGAIRYVTSAGNEKQVEDAKKIVLYAIIGLVIAILAIVIIQLVATTVETGGMEVSCCKITSLIGGVGGCESGGCATPENQTICSKTNGSGNLINKCEPYYCPTGQICGGFSASECGCVPSP